MSSQMLSVLPINFDHGITLDPIEAYEIGTLLSGEYIFAKPFPHIVLDNFLPNNLLEHVLESFPVNVQKNDTEYIGGYGGHNKRQISPYDCNQITRELFYFFNSAPFLQFMEGLTGVSGIIPDPYFGGGGFHEISKDGKLGIHADFRINERLHLHRRFNVLIYLNKNWVDTYGGNLELWSKDMLAKVVDVQPIFNRCVIFNTDENSFHGHPDPLNTPDGITRKSIALYCYTASEDVYDNLPMHSTMYKARPNDGAEVISQANSLNFKNYLRDWMSIAIMNPRYLLPPALFRKLKVVIRKLRT